MKVIGVQLFSSKNAGYSKFSKLSTTPISTESDEQKKECNLNNQPNYGINFKAKTATSRAKNILSDKAHEIESNLSYFGQELVNKATELAKTYKLSALTQPVVLLASLIGVKEYIDRLDNGEEVYSKDSSFLIPRDFESEISETIFSDKDKRKKILPVINSEIAFLKNKLEQTKDCESSLEKNKDLNFVKDFLNDIYSIYKSDNAMDEYGADGLVHGSTFFRAALFPNNEKMYKEISEPFIMKMKDEILVDKTPLDEKIHLSFYNDNAVNIWKNLAVGTNIVILNDKETTAEYLVNSFSKVFADNKDGFGKLNKSNTKIVVFENGDEIDPKYLTKKFGQYGKDPNTTYVVVMDINSNSKTYNGLTAEISEDLAIDSTNVKAFTQSPSNVKFVMIANKDKFYDSFQDSDLDGLFDNSGVVSVPLLNVEQTKKMFKEQPKLMEKIKKTFTPDAIDKSIEAANKLKGNYPEKAQKVMDLVSSYHIDKDKITSADVQEYVRVAKDIFKPSENDDSAVKVLLDTNVKIKDLIGSPAIKKEAKVIVDSIKDRSIGTKGYIIYSQDGSVGAGRKYTAKAIAGESNSPYIEINASDFGTEKVDLFGLGNASPENSMKKLFSMVKSQAETSPNKSAILFIEDFEYFSYGEMVSNFHQKAMSQLIREMDKAQEEGLNIVVVGSMSNPEYIDTATSKSFKFIDVLEIESPGYDSKARRDIVDYYLKKKNISIDGNSEKQNEIKDHINRLTEYASYIEILTLLDKTKNVMKERKHTTADKTDFTEAYLQLTSGRPSGAEEPVYRKRMVTSHECGHALNAIIMEEIAIGRNKPHHLGPKVNFITLDPRGIFGGAVFTSDMDNREYSFETVFSNIVCDFGGTSCEKRFYDEDGSYGITSDMANATKLANRAVGVMGQGKYFGKKSLKGMDFISDEDKKNIDKDVNVILKNAQVVSEVITQVYEDFNKEFVEKYHSRVGTGECIIHRDEFLNFLNEWRAKQSPEKQEEFELLKDSILQVIEATKKGVVCSRVED